MTAHIIDGTTQYQDVAVSMELVLTGNTAAPIDVTGLCVWKVDSMWARIEIDAADKEVRAVRHQGPAQPNVRTVQVTGNFGTTDSKKDYDAAWHV